MAPAGSLRRLEYRSERFGEEREIWIYTPPGYDPSAERRYPVLYLQDGQQLFVPGPFGDWLVDETLDSLHDSGRFPGVMVVGMDNSARRCRIV